MQVHDIEQRSPSWFSLRAGKPTASEFKKLVTSKGEPSKSASEYAYTLACQMYAGTSEYEFATEWMERGKEMESEALATYSFMYDCDPVSVGFVTDNDVKWGCSPDALIGDDGMAEVKCLKAENHAKAIVRWQDNQTIDPGYIQQTQGQMMVAERAWCDLIFYHPSLPLLVCRQKADKGFHAKLTTALESVLEERDKILQCIHTFQEKDIAA